MKLFYKIFLVLIVTIVGLEAQAQDVTFSQYFNNKAYINPSYAGADNGYRLGAIYREQWSAIPGVFRSYMVSADCGIRMFQGGVGIQAIQNIEGKGAYRTTGVNLQASKILRIMDNTSQRMYVYFGLQAGFFQRSLNFQNLVFSDQLDPVLGQVAATSQGAVTPTSVNKVYPDFGTGAMFRYKFGNMVHSAGLGINHLSRPNQSVYGVPSRLPQRFNLHYMGYILIKRHHYQTLGYICPGAMLEKQGYSEQINFGAHLIRRQWYGGVYYRIKRLNVIRNTDAMMFNVGYRAIFDNSYMLQIGYSYDATLSGLSLSTAGTHEISIIFEYDRLKLSNKATLSKTKECKDFDDTHKHLPVFY